MKLLDFVLVFYLEWADCSRSQLAQINKFLQKEGVNTAKLYRVRTMNAYHLRISRSEYVVRVCKRMLPYVFKKRAELQLSIDYYEGRITGDEAIKRMNRQVLSGSRSGKILEGSFPLTYSDGIHRARRRSKLSDSEVAEIVKKYSSEKPTIEALSVSYDKARSTIRKVTKGLG